VFFYIDPRNGIAIYDQIARQVMFAVASGALQPGDRVPSVREVSRSLAVNPNTVSRAYRELQSNGILETVRGTGLEITTTAQETCRKERLKMIRERMHSVVEEALRSGLGAKEIRGLLRTELANPSLRKGTL
jgi:GntR family transcriptional regulator